MEVGRAEANRLLGATELMARNGANKVATVVAEVTELSAVKRGVPVPAHLAADLGVRQGSTKTLREAVAGISQKIT